MPHELLLFAQLPQSRLDQLLNIAAGIAGAQPQRVIEHHAVYRPQREPLEQRYAVGGSQKVQTTQRAKSREPLSKDMFYWQTVRELDEAECGHTQSRNDTFAIEDQRWTIRFTDIPEPGQRPVTMRWVQTFDVVAGNPNAYMNAAMFNYVAEYIDEGFRCVHRNATMFFHRILCPPTREQPCKSPLELLPPQKDLQPLDKSGADMLQVSVTIQDMYKPETLEKAQAELLVLKETLKGVVELDPVERLVLDTRVKARLNN